MQGALGNTRCVLMSRSDFPLRWKAHGCRPACRRYLQKVPARRDRRKLASISFDLAFMELYNANLAHTISGTRLTAIRNNETLSTYIC